MQVARYENAQLTAAGNGDTINIGSVQPASAELQVTVAAIDTNVVIRMDYSTVGDFASTAASSEAKTITANGTFVFPVPVNYEYARPVFVSESGGAAATIDFVTSLTY